MASFEETFTHHLSGIAWNMWKEMGVAGTDRNYQNTLIQPEELIILTAILSKYDPRLRDEALDWSSRYHEYISVSRLRTFIKIMDIEIAQSLYQFSANLNSISSAKWPIITEAVSLTPKLSGKSRLPALDSPSLLMLRLRSLLGPGAKADILTHLLTRTGLYFSASDFGEIGYSKRSLLTALDHLAASGVLTSTNVKNKKCYELKKPKELKVLIGNLPKFAPPWINIIKAAITILTLLPEIQNSSKTTQGILLRNCLIKIEPLLPFFISPIINTPPDFERDWKSLMDLFKAFQQGNFYMQFEVHNDFESIVIPLLFDLHQVDDCIDGIEFILDKTASEETRHKDVYKECYQLFLSFIDDLKIRLTQFIHFPFHKMMDETLADIPFRYSQEQFPQLLLKLEQIQPIDRITNAQSAIRQYQNFLVEFDALRQFIHTFRKRLKDLYSIKTNTHLLSLSKTLHKRHLVLDLFKSENI